MKLFFIFTTFISIRILAFPDTIRHGYTNCTTCHVSPSGGGLINGYGRSLSRELLSTWGVQGEENILHGLVKIPEGLVEKVFFGGDSRYISRRQKTASSDVDEGFLMQAQLRVAVTYEKFKFLMGIGKIENPRVSQNILYISPEYYGVYNLQESLHLRVGRFDPVFGLRLPDHNLWIKSDLGFVPWNERDTLELIYEGETQFLSLAGFQSISTTNPAMQATGYSLSFDQIIFETTRVGVSAMNAEGQGFRQRILGGHALIGWSEKFHSMIDYSRVWSLESKKDVAYLKAGYEIYKGLTPFAQVQARYDLNDSQNDQKRYALGLTWLPRPHFELVFQIEKTESPRVNSNENYVIIHYYL